MDAVNYIVKLIIIPCIILSVKGVHAQKNETYLRVNTGINFQMLDNPFFKFETNKYSGLTFVTEPCHNFNIEISQPQRFSDKWGLIYNANYSWADMGYIGRSNIIGGGSATFNFGGSAGMSGYLMGLSFGAGVSYTEKLFNDRLWVEYAIIPSLRTYFLGNSISDTAISNTGHRTKLLLPSSNPHNYKEDMPYVIHNKLNFILKNSLSFQYHFKGRTYLMASFVYDIGLPNKAFERSFYTYSELDHENPIAFDKAVFSNSDMQWNIGVGINISRNKKLHGQWKVKK